MVVTIYAHDLGYISSMLECSIRSFTRSYYCINTDSFIATFTTATFTANSLDYYRVLFATLTVNSLEFSLRNFT